MLKHQFTRHEKPLRNDPDDLLTLLWKMDHEGYSPFCFVLPREGVTEDAFLTRLNLLNYPEILIDPDSCREYKTVWIKAQEGLRAIFFIKRPFDVGMVYTEISFLSAWASGVAEFVKLFGLSCTRDNMKLLTEKTAILTDKAHYLQCHENMEDADYQSYGHFHNQVIIPDGVYGGDGTFGVLGILQVSELVDDSGVHISIVEKLCIMLRHYYETLGVNTHRWVSCVTNERRWHVPVCYPPFQHIEHVVRNGYLIFTTHDFSELSSGPSLIAQDIDNMGELFDTDFLLKNSGVNAALACEQAIRMVMCTTLFGEDSYHNFFNIPDSDHPNEKGELNIGFNLIPFDQLEALPPHANKDDLYRLIPKRKHKIDLLDIRPKGNVKSVIYPFY